MAEIIRAGQPDSLGHIDTTQGEFRTQIDAITNTVRQLGGNPDVSATSSDPLNAPFVLYVDSNIGSDVFVAGDYTTTPNTTYEDKMRRISLQRLQCGYTQSRPFRTINRAIIEAGIITSRDYLNLNPAPCGDLVSIVLAPGVHTILNGIGAGSTSAWTDGQDPTDAELIEFNPNGTGGVLLPRGVSLISLDLRKTILRPNSVPTPADEAANLSNRRACFKLTGGCYAYGFTVMDQQGSTASHHLLDVFQFASEAELDDFYAKIVSSFGEAVFSNFVEDDYAVTRSDEYQIVGPQPASPTSAVDTVTSSSPYIYNISIRSTLGLCGLLADGARVPNSFRSCVIAQYTGVSLQKDPTCWEIYSGGTWTTAGSAAAVIAADPNDVRMDPNRRSVHIRAVNNAVIQEVSVFAIGQGIHHLSESGSNVTITNSNSNFGGCSALAVGFTDQAAPEDGDWETVSVRRALDPFEKSNSVQKIFLGRLSESSGVNANNTTTLVLDEGLSESTVEAGQPDVLAREGYSLKEDDLVWVLNPSGIDYQAELAGNAWVAGAPTEIDIKTRLQTGEPSARRENVDGTNTRPDIAGLRVYVRRLKDTRTTEERTYTVKLEGATSLRVPNADYILRDVAGSWSAARLSAVAQASADLSTGARTVDVQLRNANAQGGMAWSANTYYRIGDVIRRDNKHFTAVRDTYRDTFESDDWDESFVHMESSYTPESPLKNAAPQITFDGDTDSDNENSRTCGFTIGNASVEAQYQSATDYKGMQYYLTTTGSAISLVPQTADNRNITFSSDDVEFRRPSNVRLYGHAFEWSGFGNYSTALPQYQGTLTNNNKFTYYFTNEEGGKCYVSGFNEEGLQVTSAGLVNLETGLPVSIVDLGQDDVSFEPPPLATRDQSNPGLIALQDADTLPNLTGAEIAAYNEAIDSSTPAVTKPYLDAYKEANRLVTALPIGIPYALLHVCSSGGSPLTGEDSIPFGVDNDPGVEWSVNGNAFHKTIFNSLTEAVEKASALFLPTGSTVVISIHDDLNVTEPGPIQLVNGFAQFLVAGARGATNPTIDMKWGTTENACRRIPQYRGVNAYSAGAVFADLTLNLDNNSSSNINATFNGGFACGGRDMITNWSNVARYSCACTCSYGEQINISFYGSSLHFITNNIISQGTDPSDFVRLNLLGSDSRDSGLTGHGCSLIVDFKEDDTPAGFRFSHSITGQPKCSLLDLGKRAGVKSGGRVLPKVDFDFSNDNWDLSEIVGYNYLYNPNLNGKQFRCRELNTSASADFNINSTSLGTVTPAELRNGNQVDIERSNSSAPTESGFFSILTELEKDPSISGLLLTADNTTNAYVYFPPATAAPEDSNRNTTV